ncbi:MAG: 3-deoxy-D-manno-octulosonic acid transferase [Hyphomicrobiaceae bacterium]
MTSPMLKTGDSGEVPSTIPPAPDRVELRLYTALTRAAVPAAPLILWWRQRCGKEDAARLGERLGKTSFTRPEGPLVWIHAASVGETSSILPLIRRLGLERPTLTFLLTTGTVTSAKFAAPRLPPRTIHQYVPLDSPRLVTAFLDHWQPSLGVFTEQEIWPNLVLEAFRRHVPLALVNARMSDTSFERWHRRPGLAKALFSRFSIVLCQNDTLAARFRALGAATAANGGNLKVDAPPPAVDAEAHRALDEALGPRPRIVAASTHPGEEEALAAAHKKLRQTSPGLVTIIAPRHPDRGPAIAAAMTAHGLEVARRQKGQLPGPTTDIYVADTIGELGTLYASTAIAFIGGSLVPHGGQNPIEAVQHGAVVVAGPHTRNFADAIATLTQAGGAEIVADAEQLEATLRALLASPERVATMRTKATQALSRMAGALERTSSALLALLPDDAMDREAKRRAV